MMENQTGNNGVDSQRTLSFPLPLGAQARASGVQFTLFSRHATRVWLLLFQCADDDIPYRTVSLDPARHRFGDLWQIFVPEARAGQFYCYRAAGPTTGPVGAAFDSERWLVDPYARAVAGSPRWGDTRGLPPGSRPKNGALCPKGIIVTDAFNWGRDRAPRIPLEDLVIYEAHIRGFTAHSSAGTRYPGTFRGFISKIPYLRKLGVNAVEFLPCQEFDETEFQIENGPRVHRLNYWGYSTQAFFAPMGRYAAAGVTGEQVTEFRQLVKALHAAGIEVILDVVFNHTFEGGSDGPTFSFRGLDNSIYYQLEPDGQTYRNYSGCGNTVNCNHPVVQDFILDCLHYWVCHMHVDGFRFDLASVFTRGRDGEVLAAPPIVDRITEDPLLRDVKIIGEMWDAAGLYQVGHFPSKRWSEWNGKYRDDIRAFWQGQPHLLRAFAARFAGSPDLYNRLGQDPRKSINYVASHDGFTMRDLLSYERKHNEANGEGNRDGDNHNHSRNYGVEGPSADPAIETLRTRQQRNLFATLFLSRGVPMFLAGDEFGRTQQGNNNAYCQDNEISWVNWRFLHRHTALHRFVCKLLAFRRAHPALRAILFPPNFGDYSRPAGIVWHGPEGRHPNWDHDRAIAAWIDGDRTATGRTEPDDDLYCIFNPDERDWIFQLPETRHRRWQICFTTLERRPHLRQDNRTLLATGQSVTVLRAPRH